MDRLRRASGYGSSRSCGFSGRLGVFGVGSNVGGAYILSGGSAVRNYIINKIVGFQYYLRKIIGKRMARYICIGIEKTFTTVFGRERYQ